MNRIRDLRIAQYPKMSQEKLGQIVGVGRSTVAMWESGKSEPDNVTLIKLAETFDVSTDYLLGRDVQKEESVPKDGDGEPVFGEQLKEFRVSKKLSQKELAAKLFVSAQAVSKWERNEATPNPEAIVKISQIFGISTDELLGCSEEKKAPAPTEEDGQSDAEKALLEMFRLVPDKDRGMVTQMIEAALRSQGLL